VNWSAISEGKAIKGFIGYKAGMVSAYVVDNTEDSMTKGKHIAIPATIIECPAMKIFSVRFYKDGLVVKDVLAENLDKELKHKVKVPKVKKKFEAPEGDYDDVHVICYSLVKNTGIKKTPDLIELDLAGSKEEKLNFVKENITKEIAISDVFEKDQLIDVRGLTTGRGLQGPVKRFGITLKSHKSEKGRRRPGSLGPWHPARVTFRAPQAGQLGMFTRIIYNNKILEMGKNSDRELKNIKNFGDIKTDYIIVKGSIMGPSKRQLLLTSPLRQTKKQLKKNYELVRLG
jgi:large subunit ribosomal protein L3